MEIINSVSGLDALLAGNAPATVPNETPPNNIQPTTEPEADKPVASDVVNGGDQNDLDPAKPEDPKVEGAAGGEPQDEPKRAAAFAKMRIEANEANKVILALAKALDLDVTDPVAARQMLLNMSSQKLAEKAQLPVEVYNELNNTKEQLAQIQYQQRQVEVRQSLLDIKTAYELDDKEILAFANKLDAEGINPLINPTVDLEYEFYKRNAKLLEQKRIDKAVETALRKTNTAEQHSSNPGNQVGKSTGDDKPGKITTVAQLDDLLK